MVTNRALHSQLRCISGLLVVLSVGLCLSLLGFEFDVRAWLRSSSTTPNGFDRHWSRSGRFSALMEHDVSSENITASDEALMREIFAGYDTDKSGEWSIAEFAPFIVDLLRPAEVFAIMDRSGNGYVEFTELICYLQSMGSVPYISSAAMTEPVHAIFGGSAEPGTPNTPGYYVCLARIMCFELDPNGYDYITESAYTSYVTDHEWMEYNTDSNAVIDFGEFRARFFTNPLFQILQEVRSETIEYPELFAVARAELATYAGSSSGDGSCLYDGRSDLHPHTYDNLVADYYRNNPADTGPGTGTGNRRRMLSITTSITIAADGTVTFQFQVVACYSVNGTVSVATPHGPETRFLADVAVGDRVWDGDAFSKIFYIDRHEDERAQEMLKIEFKPLDMNMNMKGINHVSLTGNHLLHVTRADSAVELVRALDVSVGDLLVGDLIVTDISLDYARATNPVTMSGNLVVNGAKTSCFSHSAREAAHLQSAGVLFRWVSDYISEDLAVIAIDLYYHRVYKVATRQLRLGWILDYIPCFASAVVLASLALASAAVLRLLTYYYYQHASASASAATKKKTQ